MNSDGRSSYLIETPNGGNLLVQGNVLQKGLHSENHGVAISIGIEGVTNPTGVLLVRDNQFRNDQPVRTTFVRNASALPAVVIDNQIKGDVIPLIGAGGVPAQE